MGVLWGLLCLGLILASPIICLCHELSTLHVAPCCGLSSEVGPGGGLSLKVAGPLCESPVAVMLCVWVRPLD